MLELARWISRKRTKREDEWFQAVIANLTAIFEFLGLEPPISDRKPSLPTYVRHGARKELE